MSGKRTIVGYRVRLKEPTPSGAYVAAEAGTWTLWHDAPRPVSRKRAQALFDMAARWRKRARSGRARWVPVWSLDDLRIVRIVKGGGK